MGYKSYTAKRKPVRTLAQIKKRLKFAKEHQYWLMLNRKNGTYIRRLKSETNQSFNFIPRVQGGGGNVSVWGCISGGAHAPLLIYNEALPMFIHNAFNAGDHNWTYVQDNAPSHTSKYTMHWMKNNGIHLVKWPASSPDLNPIENLWDHIDKQLRKLKPTNVGQLQTMIEDRWLGITAKQCLTFVNSMPRRIKQ
ncbi:unnamed protein product [Rotaria magnacalcarata]|uniref:Tc1-like transposase DDE domain-containing protein n=2 Tax=Rotaria magnacalcarata TaxID=392030 RepID=A0A814DVG1_9BILA|nr:unnamed protein product [Rotaria magnacalcarata]CAF3797980.1 unnamed protein product [Rotaria magnacalcarata]